MQERAVLLDAMMPGFDGWSVLSALKADPELAGIPVMNRFLPDGPSDGLRGAAANGREAPAGRRRTRSDSVKRSIAVSTRWIRFAEKALSAGGTTRRPVSRIREVPPCP